MPKNKPNTGDTNWGVTLNQHLEQFMPNGGGINFSPTDPGSLTPVDDGYTFVNTTTKELKRWTGTNFNVLLSGLPAGSISQFAGTTAPSGWFLCDGNAISRTTYSNLFAILGSTYGEGDGSTTFNLPDMRGRVGIGSSTSINPVITVSANSLSGATAINLQSVKPIFLARGTKITFTSGPTGIYVIADVNGIEVVTSSTIVNLTSGINANLNSTTVVNLIDGNISSKNLGVVGGSEQTTLSIDELPNHTHNVPQSSTTGANPVALTGAIAGGNITTSSSGGGLPHNNIQPFVVVNYIIKI